MLYWKQYAATTKRGTMATQQELEHLVGQTIFAKVYSLEREIKLIRFQSGFLVFETPHGRGRMHPMFISGFRIVPCKEGKPSDWNYTRGDSNA